MGYSPVLIHDLLATGPWPIGHQPTGMAGECTHICVHYPHSHQHHCKGVSCCVGASSSVCACAWVLVAPFAHTLGHQQPCMHMDTSAGASVVWVLAACLHMCTSASATTSATAGACGSVCNKELKNKKQKQKIGKKAASDLHSINYRWYCNYRRWHKPCLFFSVMVPCHMTNN